MSNKYKFKSFQLYTILLILTERNYCFVTARGPTVAVLFWSSFQYSNHVVIIKKAYLESDKINMIFVSDIFLIQPEIIWFLF